MITVKGLIRNIPILREIFVFFYRLRIALGYFTIPIQELIFWLFQSKEVANFTYDLTYQNKRYLASMIAYITKRSYEEIFSYITELETNFDLRTHIQNTIKASSDRYFADLNVHYGRRLGWYAIIRVLKPKVVVETGVDKGLGSCIITAALLQNEQEGCLGYYYGTDINPKAGFLLHGDYAKYGTILYGDSLKSLESFNLPIDIFINDSDHTEEYEMNEYKTISEKLSKTAVILGDNSHETSSLLNFALQTNRQFIFFQEKPSKHWYPGAGIGIAF